MDRRRAIKTIAALTGGAFGLSIAATLFKSRESPEHADTPLVLSREQDELLQVLTELIIPATDTPGAGAAGVHRFIDHMLAHWYTPAEREVFLDGLADVESRAHERFGTGFLQLDEAAKNSMLATLESKSNLIWFSRVPAETPSFFAMLKVMTLRGYYASEIGATQELRSNVVPGSYRGCIPYAEIGSGWS